MSVLSWAASGVPSWWWRRATMRSAASRGIREIQALIDGAELVVLEKAGHLSPLEVPQDLARYIEAWLAGQRLVSRPS